MENTAKSGMIAYEQICEQILEKQDVPDKEKIWFQVNILDKAQNVFEEHNAHQRNPEIVLQRITM